MKTIGLIAGMSWESSAIYYRHINTLVNQSRGGTHSAEILMRSVDYSPFLNLAAQGNWHEVGCLTAFIAKTLEKGGAACIAICCNTVHHIADAVTENIGIPFIHIADPCGAAIRDSGSRRVALLGTRTTTEQGFFKNRLLNHFGIEVMVPDEEGRVYLDGVIKNELCTGQFLDTTRKKVISMIHQLKAQGAEGVILGCTELPLLIKDEDCDIPVFDTTWYHSKALVEFALSN